MPKPLSPIQLLRKNPKRSGRKAQRKDNYASSRSEFIEQSKQCCEVCGSPHRLEVHHKIGRMGSRLWDARYFMLVCNPCHMSIHSGVKEAKKLGHLLVLTNEEERIRKETQPEL